MALRASAQVNLHVCASSMDQSRRSDRVTCGFQHIEQAFCVVWFVRVRYADVHGLDCRTGAASTRVSNELGAGHPHMLVPIVAAASMLAAVISGSSATLFILARCACRSSLS